VIGPGEAIRWSPALTERVDWEAELAVVIGAPARRVPAARASEVIFGYTAANDVSARDLQFGDGQWVRGKSLDTFGPLGPWIVTRDEIADAQALTVSCTVNGERMQHANTAQMIFGIAALIEFITHSFTLLPGDIILTGTPSGVGDARKPPRFLHDGDVVTVELEGIGALTNPCREE
jgi:2-keto-4-pentenoate hydratase/2-oxohepta-3-ene-1,7-dioic acid hydratase in catechol pathway